MSTVNAPDQDRQAFRRFRYRLLDRVAARLCGIVLGTFVLLSLGSAASAQSAQGERKAQVELITPKTTVRPGETVEVGIKFTMQPGWHIYWKNPGDAGQAPTFRWNLPGGGAARALRGGPWQASEPQFPTPIRWVDPGGIIGYGYTDTVIFPATLTVPGSVTPGQSAEVTVAVDYLICKDVCIPESATATASFQVGMDVADLMDDDRGEEAAQAVEQAKQQLPQPSEGKVKVSRESEQVTIRAQLPAGAKEVAFFPNPPAGLSVENIETDVRGDTATIRFTTRPLSGMTVSQKQFDAVVGYTTSEGRRGLTTQVPIPSPSQASESGRDE